MAREIIVTDASKAANGDITLSVVFWLAVPATRVRPAPSSFKSAVPDSTVVTWGATTAEKTALTNGTVLELTSTVGQLPSGSTVASIKQSLQDAYTAAQNALNASAFATNFVGAFWDGTTWTLQP